MAFAIRHLVAFSVLLHAAFGCCAHHGHAAECGHSQALGICLHEHEDHPHAHSTGYGEGVEAGATESREVAISDNSHSHRPPCLEAGCSFPTANAKVKPVKVIALPSCPGSRIAFDVLTWHELSTDVSDFSPSGFAGLSLHLALRQLRL